VILYASTQAAAEYGGATASSALRTLTTLAGDVQDFIGDNPTMVVAVLCLGVFFFWMTRPRVR
jgi:hypothetical protein